MEDICPKIKARVMALRKKDNEAIECKARGLRVHERRTQLAAQLMILEYIADDLSFLFYSNEETGYRHAFMKACGFSEGIGIL